jgi:hypothetical protein
MGEKIYGIDLSEKVTPAMVRDAIIRCFTAAHKEALSELNKEKAFKSESERKGFEAIQINLIVKYAFEDMKADFDNPKKEDIVRVIEELARFASRFRKPEIIKRHYNEIKRLIEKCSQ